MLGFGDKGTTTDPTKLPIFVHAIQSADAFALAQKVWHSNERYRLLDPSNRKELVHFAFAHPSCAVWLQRDQGRTDCFELILEWATTQDKDQVTEVYVVSQAATPIGDDTRAKSLLSSILASPATVPVHNGANS